MERQQRVWIGFSGLLAALLFVGVPLDSAFSATFELSGSGYYDRRAYDDGSLETNLRWSTGLGLHFNESSGIEATYINNTQKDQIPSLRDIRKRDQIYSINWVQLLVNRRAAFQPYFKLGLGWLDRKLSVTYADGSSADVRGASLTNLLTLGFKIMVSESIGIKAEGTTYIANLRFSSWRDNVALGVGGSIFF